MPPLASTRGMDIIDVKGGTDMMGITGENFPRLTKDHTGTGHHLHKEDVNGIVEASLRNIGRALRTTDLVGIGGTDMARSNPAGMTIRELTTISCPVIRVAVTPSLLVVALGGRGGPTRALLRRDPLPPLDATAWMHEKSLGAWRPARASRRRRAS